MKLNKKSGARIAMTATYLKGWVDMGMLAGFEAR
jgi:hypothetical protein